MNRVLKLGPKAGARLLVAVVAMSCLALFAPRSTRGGQLGADVVALFPKEVGEFAYADLKKARTLPWFPQLQQQMLPERFRQFEKFLASAGVDPNTQVEELAWGLVAEGVTAKTAGVGNSAVPTGEQVVGVALGNYNPESTESYFKQQKLPTFKVRNYTLYAFGSGSGANVINAAAPTEPTVMPRNAVTLLRRGPRARLVSRIAAPIAVVPTPTQNPWTTRARINCPTSRASENRIIAAAFSSSAASITGRRPT